MSRNAQSKIVARLRRLVVDAQRAGLSLVADGTPASGGGVRVMTTEEEEQSRDLRNVGVCVPLHNGCGIDDGDSSGGGKWL